MTKKDKTNSTLLNHLDPWCTCPSLWIGSSVGSKTIGSDPPSGLVYRVGGFSHISCTQSLRGGTSPAHSLYMEAHEPSLASRRLELAISYVLNLNSLPENPPYPTVAFSNPKTSNYLKNQRRKFHLSASVFYLTCKNPKLALI